MYGIPPFNSYLRKLLVTNGFTDNQVTACFEHLNESPDNHPLTRDGITGRIRELLSFAERSVKMTDLLDFLCTEYGLKFDLTDYPEYKYRWLYRYLFFQLSREEIEYILKEHYPAAYREISWGYGIEYVIAQLMIYCQHNDQLPSLVCIASQFNMPYFLANFANDAHRDFQIF